MNFTTKEKLLIVSEKYNKFFDLSDVIPEMMLAENMTEQECIDYFMNAFSATRFMKFPKGTPSQAITQWITSDMGLDWYGENTKH